MGADGSQQSQERAPQVEEEHELRVVPAVPATVAGQLDTTPARPTAQLIARHAHEQLTAQVAAMTDLDTKASLIAAGATAVAVATAVLMTSNGHLGERTQDIGIASLGAAIVALVIVAVGVWRPRPADLPPHPYALRRDHWHDSEEDVLRFIVDAQVTAFTANKAVESAKVTALKWAIAVMAVAVAFLAETAIAIAVRT